MNLPLISICIPAYNAAAFIHETIDCWLKQTYQNLEIIIQDDCSTDETYQLSLAKAENDGRIKVFKNSKNLGIGGNWNEAYYKAKGQYIVIFNADDLVYPQFLSKCLEKFNQHPAISFVFSAFVKKNSDLTKNLNDENYYLPFEGLFNGYDHRKHHRFLSWCFCLAKAESFKALESDYGLFYPTQCCDADLWITLDERKIDSYYIGEALGIYRQHPNNNSKNSFAEFESIFRDIIWRHPKFFKTHFYNSFIPKLKTIIYYMIKKNGVDYNVIRNFIKYEFFK